MFAVGEARNWGLLKGLWGRRKPLQRYFFTWLRFAWMKDTSVAILEYSHAASDPRSQSSRLPLLSFLSFPPLLQHSLRVASNSKPSCFSLPSAQIFKHVLPHPGLRTTLSSFYELIYLWFLKLNSLKDRLGRIPRHYAWEFWKTDLGMGANTGHKHRGLSKQRPFVVFVLLVLCVCVLLCSCMCTCVYERAWNVCARACGGQRATSGSAPQEPSFSLVKAGSPVGLGLTVG